MFQRRIPDLLRHAPVPGVRSFAVLAGIESAARAIMVSVFPIAMYNTFRDPEKISEIYLLIGIFSFITSLFVPWVSQFLPRRKLYTLGVLSLIAGTACSLIGGPLLLPLGLSVTALAVVTITICFNAYVMDFVARASLDEAETRRLQYSGGAWTLGPFLGIWLYQWWQPAPFIISLCASILLLIVFWIYRLGDGKTIVKAKAKPANPLAFLPSFFKQPRLIIGWTFAVVRSCGWWVYVVYLPIYAVENGLSEQIGGLFLSCSNALLFLVPFLLRWLNGRVRYGVAIGFIFSGLAFIAAALLASYQVNYTLCLLFIGSAFLILLDMCGGLPFLMAVKPSERTEMSAVYSTYRDVSNVIGPGIARITLVFLPLSAVFAVFGAGLLATAFLAKTLHPRLGKKKNA
ncbi:MAG: ACDE family multidrug resistance protein [Saprospiraceae bacterium]|jgi:ACDE family multidrug resistance protein